YLRYSPYGLAYALAAQFGARGPITTISTACTSSSQAIGYALDKIRHGEADIMLAGGAECLMEPTMVAGFILLGALSKNNDNPQGASRPFDGERAGFGTSITAYRITDSPPDGQGPMIAMQAALQDANLAASEIDYINAHGTSTV